MLLQSIKQMIIDNTHNKGNSFIESLLSARRYTE